MSFSPFTQIPYTANGNISPRRFIVGVAASAQKAVQATGSTLPIMGVSYDKTRFPPNSPSDDGFNAVADEHLSYHSWGEIASVDTGAAITDVTIPVTSDGSGKAIPVNLAAGQTTALYVAGFPMDVVASGEVVRVLLQPSYRHHPALS